MRSWCGNLPAGKATRKAAQKARAPKRWWRLALFLFPGHQHATSLGAQKTGRTPLATTSSILAGKKESGMYAQNCLVALVDATRSGADGTVCNPGLSANSVGDKTVRPCETCEGGSRFWALLQHLQEEAPPSKTQRYDEGCLLDSPCLNGLQDLFLAVSEAHDRSPIWSFTYP